MPVILFDTSQRNLLSPFTLTRAIADIRVGIFTIRERWELLSKQKIYVLTEPCLQAAYTQLPEGESLFINASVIADENLLALILNLQLNEAIVKDGEVIAGLLSVNESVSSTAIVPERFRKCFSYDLPLKQLIYPWHIFQLNDEMIRSDFALLATRQIRKPVADNRGWTAPENIFIEDGAVIAQCFINAFEGPVYLGKNTVVMEGCMIRGPFAMGEGSVLKMGTKIYGATTLGPYSIAGGEIKNSVFWGFSNKAHDGYLGDSVIGAWCNLGAGTSGSNIRNDAAAVHVNIGQGRTIPVGLKCGLLMGDYSRCAINTSFNTGTFAGIASNIFGPGFAPKYLPDFTWGFTQRYIFDKAIEHIANWKKLKHHELTPTEIKIIEHRYKQTLT